MHHELMQTPELPEAIRARVRPLPPGLEELDSRQVVPYAPTPGMPYDIDVLPHQRTFEQQMRDLILNHAPENITAEIRAAIETDFMAGKAKREHENYSRFHVWMDSPQHEYMINHGLLDSYDEQQVAKGTASQNKVIGLVQNTSIESLEVGALWHPYYYYMEHLPDMRRSAQQAIIDQGGKLTPEDPYRNHKIAPVIDESSREELKLVPAFRVTYKHTIGYVKHAITGSDIYIHERQTALAVVGMDMSPHELKHAEELLERTQKDNRDDNDNALLIKEAEQRITSYLIDETMHDTAAEYFMPLSTTIYTSAEK